MEQPARYWVYVDDPTNHARVHEYWCRFCRDGQGVKDSRLPDNRWIGPFRTLSEADAAMARQGKLDSARCGICRPK